ALEVFQAKYQDTKSVPKTPKDLVVMDECGLSTHGFWIYSFHIQAPLFTFKGYEEASLFLDNVVQRVPKQVHQSIFLPYSPHVQYIRILGSTFKDNPRHKKISPYSHLFGTTTDLHQNALFVNHFLANEYSGLDRENISSQVNEDTCNQNGNHFTEEIADLPVTGMQKARHGSVVSEDAHYHSHNNDIHEIGEDNDTDPSKLATHDSVIKLGGDIKQVGALETEKQIIKNGRTIATSVLQTSSHDQPSKITDTNKSSPREVHMSESVAIQTCTNTWKTFLRNTYNRGNIDSVGSASSSTMICRGVRIQSRMKICIVQFSGMSVRDNKDSPETGSPPPAFINKTLLCRVILACVLLLAERVNYCKRHVVEIHPNCHL
ncbi:17089_t:CDS:2, partial [Rhizophagus irregularis]